MSAPSPETGGVETPSKVAFGDFNFSLRFSSQDPCTFAFLHTGAMLPVLESLLLLVGGLRTREMSVGRRSAQWNTRIAEVFVDVDSPPRRAG